MIVENSMRQTHTTWRGLVTVCTLLAAVLSHSQASAQQDGNRNPVANEVRPDNLAAVPNSGAAGPDHDNGVSFSGEVGHLDKIKEGETKLTRLPANLAFRGLADSKQYKQMFREMVTAEVPTLFQTMMMVENGAANGYIGALQSVSNLLGNTVQAADLELKMRRIADPSGASERDYVNAIHEGLKKQNDNQGKHLWPVGIFFASGDNLHEVLTDSQKAEVPFKEHDFGGASNVDHLPRHYNAGNNYEWKLSDLVWGKQSSGDNRAEGLKQLQIDVFGDVQFNAVKPIKGDPNVIVTKTFIAPKIKPLKVKGGGGAGTGGTARLTTMSSDLGPPQQLQGIRSYQQTKREEVWEGMYKLLDEYCKFKTQNENRNKEIFQKQIAASKLTTEMIQKVSSPNMAVTINLIDQIFKIWVQTAGSAQEPTKIKCDFSKSEPKDSMPDDWTPPTQILDNCEKNPKQCTRNKWMYKFVDMIALDKLLEEVKGAHESAMMRLLSSDPSAAIVWQELMCASVQSNTQADGAATMCDVGFYFEALMGQNRGRWHTELEELAKLAQSLGGSSNFRFQPNNSLAAAGGGYDSAGDADPGSGGGSGS
ncbi:MAG: hypothetical protein ACK5GN_06385 [Pseudomonadota bacterium]|jgi:flagellar hook-basal body complex protein FliE